MITLIYGAKRKKGNITMPDLPIRKITISDYEQQGLARLKQLAPSLDASVYGSYITTLIRSFAAAIYPATYLVEDAFNNAFVQYAKGNALDEFHGKQEGLQRNPATPAVGDIVIYADVGTVIPTGTEFLSGSTPIRTKTSVTIGERVFDISCEASNGIVTCTTTIKHYLPVDGMVTIATGTATLDGECTITSASDLVFQYQIKDKNTFSAKGKAKSISNVVSAETVETGYGANIPANMALSGDYKAYTLQDGLTGAADEESDEDYQARIIEARGTLEGVLSEPQIILAAKKITGNTRVWVVSPKKDVAGGEEGKPGYKPQPGQVCFYFVRDKDINIFPNQTLIEQTRQSVLQYGKLPANTIPEDVMGFAPIKNEVIFKISGLDPDSPEMRNAIESELKAYIEDFVDFQEGFSQQMQDAVIARSSVAGVRWNKSFNNQTGDIEAKDGTLIVYGGVAWL